MRASLGIGLVALLAVASAAAGIRKGPWIQDLGPDRTRLVWESDHAVACSVEVGSPGAAATTHSSPPRVLHSVSLGGLERARRYAYTVTCDGDTARGEFATAPEPGVATPFAFVVYGDSQDGADIHRAVVDRISSEVPEFAVRTGDLTDDGGNEALWQEFFDVERDFLRETPFFAAMGNHDHYNDGLVNWGRFFSPDPTSPRRYHAFTYANARFVILDSNDHSFVITDQTQWLERELAATALDPGIDHVFVFFHEPAYSISLHRGHAELREVWCPLFEQYGVDAVFSGHDHNYQRLEHNGVRYFVAGGAGSSLYPVSPIPAVEDVEASRHYERTYNFLLLRVSGEVVELAARREDGSLIELVTWGLPGAPALAAPEPPPPLAVSAPADAAAGCRVGGGGAGSWAVLALLALLAARASGRRSRVVGVRR